MSEAQHQSPEPGPEDKLQEILDTDLRYNHDAYLFVFEALNYTQDKFSKIGHITGQELCRGIKDYAIERFGMLAKAVLNDWGILKTDDIGEIVFNLIEFELMKKTDHDRREDFHGVYDLDKVFDKDFKFDRPLHLEEE